MNSTKDYVAAAYVSIFTQSPVSAIQNRVISLSELAPTGEEIAAVMKEKNGAQLEIIPHSLEKVNSEVEVCIQSGEVFAVHRY